MRGGGNTKGRGMTTRRLPLSAHRACGWRIDEIAADLRVEDVWDLGLAGARDDFPRLVRLVTAFDVTRPGSTPARMLFAAREKIGAALGWDRTDESRADKSGIDDPSSSLQDRLP